MSELKDVMRPGVTRGLDFVTISELRKRTGITPPELLKFAVAEILCNALDKEDATMIKVDVQAEDDFYRVSVGDNGSKAFTEDELKLILEFENKASSKRGFLMVSRGYLGNALKCLFGYSHALAVAEGLNPPDIIVEAGDHEYSISLEVDRIQEVIHSRITSKTRNNDDFTTITLKFPIGQVSYEVSHLMKQTHKSSPTVLKDILFARAL